MRLGLALGLARTLTGTPSLHRQTTDFRSSRSWTFGSTLTDLAEMDRFLRKLLASFMISSLVIPFWLTEMCRDSPPGGPLPSELGDDDTLPRRLRNSSSYPSFYMVDNRFFDVEDGEFSIVFVDRRFPGPNFGHVVACECPSLCWSVEQTRKACLVRCVAHHDSSPRLFSAP